MAERQKGPPGAVLRFTGWCGAYYETGVEQ
jgi:hypothetical protein